MRKLELKIRFLMKKLASKPKSTKQEYVRKITISNKTFEGGINFIS